MGYRLRRRHYSPLLDLRFLELYEELGLYRKELRFAVNGQAIEPGTVQRFLGLDKVKAFFPTASGKRIGYGLFGISAAGYPLGHDACGVLVCTHGKVVKAEFFNQFPGVYGPRLFGLVEVPQLVNYLTTAKTDFIRAQGKYRQFERLYDPPSAGVQGVAGGPRGPTSGGG